VVMKVIENFPFCDDIYLAAVALFSFSAPSAEISDLDFGLGNAKFDHRDVSSDQSS